MVERPVAAGGGTIMDARREPPDALDYFPTPPWATRALFRHVLRALGVEAVGSVWEPACGEGHMAEVIDEFAQAPVTASDVFGGYGYGSAALDFVNDQPRVKADWIITHPPFNLACDFTLRALDLATAGVAMLVRTQWIEGIERYERLFREQPPTIYAPFVERVPMVKGRWDPAASTATSCAWFAWLHAHAGRPSRIFWIPPGCRGSLTKPDDRARFAAWTPAAGAPVVDHEPVVSIEPEDAVTGHKVVAESALPEETAAVAQDNHRELT